MTFVFLGLSLFSTSEVQKSLRISEVIFSIQSFYTKEYKRGARDGDRTGRDRTPGPAGFVYISMITQYTFMFKMLLFQFNKTGGLIRPLVSNNNNNKGDNIFKRDLSQVGFACYFYFFGLKFVFFKYCFIFRTKQ